MERCREEQGCSGKEADPFGESFDEPDDLPEVAGLDIEASEEGWDVDTSVAPYLKIEAHLVQQQQLRLSHVLGRVVEQLGLAEEILGETKTRLDRTVAKQSKIHRELLVNAEKNAYQQRVKLAGKANAGTLRVPSETGVKQAVVASEPYRVAREEYDAAKASTVKYRLRVTAIRTTLDQLSSLSYFQGAETRVLRSSMTEQ